MPERTDYTVIRCMECSPPLDWDELGIATRHVQRVHRRLVRGLDGYELAFAIRGALKVVEVLAAARPKTKPRDRALTKGRRDEYGPTQPGERNSCSY